MTPAAALRVQAQALRAQADTLDALADAVERDAPDALLGLKELREHGVGRAALLGAADRGELAVSRGPRGRLQVRRSELDRWLASRPVERRQHDANIVDMDAWDRAAAERLTG